MIYITCLLFERCELISAADLAATEASIGWKDNDNVSLDKRNINIYWRIFDGKASSKIESASQRAQKHFRDSGIKSFTSVQGYAAYHNGLFNKSIRVGIRNLTEFPRRIVMNQFGLSSTIFSDIASCSAMPDNADFIRNIDLVADLEKELENDVPQLKSFVGGFNGIIGKIREYIGGLL
jgi:hypothetical protein